MQGIRVNVNITIGGQVLSEYKSFSIEQELFTHHSFEVTVPYEALVLNEGSKGAKGFIYKNHLEKYCGQIITIEVTGKIDNQKEYLPLQFMGIITNIVVANFNSADGSNDFNHRFVLSGYSPTYLLEGGSRRRTFRNKDLKSIFDNVLEYYPNRFARELLAPQHQDLVEYAVQYDESAYTFLRRLADEYGEWFYYDGTCLRLGFPPTQKRLRFEAPDPQTFSLGISLQPSRFGLFHYDYLIPYRLVDTSDKHPLSQPDSFTKLALEKSDSIFSASRFPINRHVHEPKELGTATQQRRESLASRLVTFKGTGEDLGFAVGKELEVWGSRQKDPNLDDYGHYRVTKVKHTVKGNMYNNEFEALPAEANHPPANPLVQPPQGVPELATVISLDDPKKLGRIQVRYFWPMAVGRECDAETNEVRVSTPYSGKGNGQLFIPEVGSQVLVGYEEGRPEFPVVLGNLFHPKNEQQVEKYTSPTNNLKFITTAGGNRITFDDQEKNERISIHNAHPNTNSNSSLEISFAASGTIKLTTKGSISLEAAQDITLSSKDITLRATNKIFLEATNEIELTTDANGKALGSLTDMIKLDSSKVEVESLGVAIKGGNSINLSADELEILGSKSTTIQGNPVKIN